MTAPATLDVSVVVPLYGGEKTIASLVERVSSTLAQEGWSYEIWLVCDQPRDRSWEIAARLASERSDTHAIRLMRNFGQHPATLLGIRRAEGATIVTMDEDLQHAPEDIPALVRESQEHGAIAYGLAEELQHAWWRNATSRLAKWFIARYFQFGDARRISAFRAFPASARTAFEHYHGERVAVDVLLSWSGLPLRPYRCQYAPRAEGESGYTFRKLVRYLSDLLLGYTTAPLRIASWMGLLSVVIAAGIALYVLINWLRVGSAVPGFAFLALSVAAFAGVQLLSLGIMGEYLGRLYFNSLSKPQYLVAEERHPSSGTRPDASEG